MAGEEEGHGHGEGEGEGEEDGEGWDEDDEDEDEQEQTVDEAFAELAGPGGEVVTLAALGSWDVVQELVGE